MRQEASERSNSPEPGRYTIAHRPRRVQHVMINRVHLDRSRSSSPHPCGLPKPKHNVVVHAPRRLPQFVVEEDIVVSSRPPSPQPVFSRAFPASLPAIIVIDMDDEWEQLQLAVAVAPPSVVDVAEFGDNYAHAPNAPHWQVAHATRRDTEKRATIEVPLTFGFSGVGNRTDVALGASAISVTTGASDLVPAFLSATLKSATMKSIATSDGISSSGSSASSSSTSNGGSQAKTMATEGAREASVVEAVKPAQAHGGRVSALDSVQLSAAVEMTEGQISQLAGEVDVLKNVTQSLRHQNYELQAHMDLALHALAEGQTAPVDKLYMPAPRVSHARVPGPTQADGKRLLGSAAEGEHPHESSAMRRSLSEQLRTEAEALELEHARLTARLMGVLSHASARQ